jgi:hypothetical protein
MGHACGSPQAAMGVSLTLCMQPGQPSARADEDHCGGYPQAWATLSTATLQSCWGCRYGGVCGVWRVRWRPSAAVVAPLAGGGCAREGAGANRQHPVNPHRTMSPRSLGTLTLTSEVVAQKAALLTASLLRQRLQERLRLLQVRGVKAFGEPAVDWRQEVMGCGPLALLLPQAGEAHGGAQL